MGTSHAFTKRIMKKKFMMKRAKVFNCAGLRSQQRTQRK